MTLAAAVTGAFGFHRHSRGSLSQQPANSETHADRNQSGQELVALPGDTPQTRASFVSRGRHAANELCGFIDRYHHSFRHVGACSRLKGRVERVHARFETGRPFVLYRANCHWPLDTHTAWFACELPRKTGIEPGRLRGANGVRRRFLVRDFRGRISRSKPDKPDLPCIRGNPRNQNIGQT
jgi:hypothetical protein